MLAFHCRAVPRHFALHTCLSVPDLALLSQVLFYGSLFLNSVKRVLSGRANKGLQSFLSLSVALYFSGFLIPMACLTDAGRLRSARCNPETCGLCIWLQVGSIIGKAGAIVKQIREDTTTRIRVVEAMPNSDDRVIVISGIEDLSQDFHGSQVCSDHLLSINSQQVFRQVSCNL